MSVFQLKGYYTSKDTSYIMVKMCNGEDANIVCVLNSLAQRMFYLLLDECGRGLATEIVKIKIRDK